MLVVIVSLPLRAVVAVKVTVQVERALAVIGTPTKVGAPGEVAALIVTFPTGLPAVPSSVVATVNSVFVYVAAGAFVRPATVNAPDCPAVSAHDAPERVTVSVVPLAAAVAAQLE